MDEADLTYSDTKDRNSFTLNLLKHRRSPQTDAPVSLREIQHGNILKDLGIFSYIVDSGGRYCQ